MRGLLLSGLLAVSAVTLSGCAQIANPYPDATTVEECRASARAARTNLSYNTDSSARAFGRGMIESMERNCIARVTASSPAAQPATPSASSQPVIKRRAGLLQSARRSDRFCPKHASVLYGGTTYCVGN